MIRYTLKCPDGHRFESWFQSAGAFEALQEAGHLACAVCGAGTVDKALMAPRVGQNSEASAATDETAAPLSAPASPAEQALARMRAHLERNSDYVGRSFAQEARAMHLGEAPERPIWGEAQADEARSLIDDGVPVLPLPCTPSRRSN
jgi:hypothetical protein